MLDWLNILLRNVIGIGAIAAVVYDPTYASRAVVILLANVMFLLVQINLDVQKIKKILKKDRPQD